MPQIEVKITWDTDHPEEPAVLHVPPPGVSIDQLAMAMLQVTHMLHNSQWHGNLS